jgi:hypothetical protein
VRVNVWPARTALNVHWFTAAVSTRLTMAWKPCACSWLTVASTDDGPDGAAEAVPASPSAAEANAPAAREETRIFLIFVPFFVKMQFAM